MGLLYTIKKPQSILPTKSYSYFIENTISETEYETLSNLISEAENAVKEEITSFSHHTFTKDISTKKQMNFRIARVLFGDELVGYSIGYCELGDPANFLIDIVYIRPNHRKHNLAYNLIIMLINSVSTIDSIEDIKLITQDENQPALNLISKIIEVAEN